MAEVNPAATPADFAQRNAPHNGGSGGSGAQGLFGSAAESVKNKAREIAEEQKTAGAERVGAMGRAVHGAADEVSKEMPGAASYIHAPMKSRACRRASRTAALTLFSRGSIASPASSRPPLSPDRSWRASRCRAS